MSNTENAVDILGVTISTSSEENILEHILKYLDNTKKSSILPFIVYTPNPEILTFALQHEWFKKIVNTAQISIPDGWGVEWAIKKIYGLRVPKVPGIDLTENLLKLAHKRSFRVGLIGGKPGLAVTSMECLSQRFTGLLGFGQYGGEFRVVGEELQIQSNHLDWIDIEGYTKLLVDTLKKEKTDILFVGLGFPKQELLIHSLKQYIEKTHYYRPIVMVSVGGSIDVLTGRVPRAPLFLRNLGLEWMFRLIVEPWRIIRMVRGSLFFLNVLLYKKR